MKYKIQLSNEAQKDIEEIYRYIAEVLWEKEIAAHMISLIEESIMSLREMPTRYSLFDLEPWRSRGVRIMSVKKYLVFYIADETEVNVLRVIFGARDIESVFCNNCPLTTNH